MDEGLVAAFEANPEGDVGRKLETTVLLHLHRRRRDRFCYADGGEVDLCTEDGTAFWNTCWSLSGADTAQREQRSMRLGQSRARRPKGVLLYNEFASRLKSALPDAQPAWRWLLEQRTALLSPALRARP